MKLRRAIVLRIYRPYRQSVVVLDDEGEKVMGWYRAHHVGRALVPGALIAYRPELGERSTQLHDVELIGLPRPSVRADLLFLHHILEIVDAFMAEASNCKPLFESLVQLYCQETHNRNIDYMSSGDKKLFVGRILALMGIYPPLSTELLPLYKIISASLVVDSVDMEHDRMQEHLSTWLLGCLSTHPRAHTFLTIDFIRTSQESAYSRIRSKE